MNGYREGEAMGLAKCPDCGTEVSTQARACPKCGRIKWTRRKVGCIPAVLVLVIALWVIGRHFLGSLEPPGGFAVPLAAQMRPGAKLIDSTGQTRGIVVRTAAVHEFPDGTTGPAVLVDFAPRLGSSQREWIPRQSADQFRLEE
jgi:hypothetical protein